MITVVVRSALLLAILVNPFLIVRHLARRADLILHIALGGATAMVLNFLVPVALHVCGIRIVGSTLASVHWVLFGMLAVGALVRRLRLLPEHCARARLLGIAALAFALLVIPWTHLAGIDTYKWQDLATNVRLAKAIPWLIHPLALLGFGPRSYPSAQPLLLATVQILGGLGVDWGFYLASLVSGITGIFAAAVLGRRLLGDEQGATWFAVLYLFSPIFLRYNHWASGRGFLVSLLPLFIWTLLRIRHVPSAAGSIVLGGMLMLSHKAGVGAAILIPALFLLSLALPRWDRRWFVAVLLVPALAAALLLAPNRGGPLGPLAGMLWNTASRFGFLAPLALLGLLAARGWLLNPAWRAMFLAGLCLYPLACPFDMYGALIAAPFVAFAGTRGVCWLTAQERPVYRRAAWVAAALAILLGLVPLGLRIRDATPPTVHAAACFLEEYDPDGPYRVIAPMRVRKQIQAYVSGCPRFDLRPGDVAAVARRPRPMPSGPIRARLRRWFHFGRHLFRLADVDVAWYGRNPRTYYIVANGEGKLPTGTRLLFSEGGVEVYAPEGQFPPGQPAGDANR